MTYAIAIIIDDTLEEPLIVLGVTMEHVAGLACDYLRVARPLMAPDGKRLEVPERSADGDDNWYDWLYERLEDLYDVSVRIYDTESGDLMPAGVFKAWIEDTRESISKQHKPLVEDVAFLDEHADKL